MESSQAIKISLSEIQVRPIISDEMSQFKKLLSRYHYLGSPAMIGSTICYVATYRERWVSLLSFSSAALKCKARDQWIGWEPCFKWQRLHLLANNTRFLILPGYSQKNLASKVLSLCLKRISIDWETYFNHSLLLVETFVDPSRFHGTCYFASNWLLLGQTRGYGKNNNRYIFHNKPKKIFVKPLHRGVQKILSHPILHPKYQKGVSQMRFTEVQTETLFDSITQISDSRSFQGQRHTKKVLMAICICATLCGARGYSSISDWASNLTQAMRKRLRCVFKNSKYIVPSNSTIRRFLIGIDPEELNKAISFWVQKQTGSESSIAIDGKTMRGTSKKKSEQVHVLSAVTHEKGQCLAQKKSLQNPMKLNMLNLC